MYRLYQKIVASGLALLLLFATLSFSVEMHFCGHTLVDVALFEKAQGCGMDMEGNGISGMSCCSDHEWVVSGQDHLNAPVQIDFTPLIYVVPSSFAVFSPLNLPVVLNSGVAAKKYYPPPLFPDLTVQLQVFLI